MSPKFLFLICALGLLSPFVLASILLDLTKRQFIFMVLATGSILLVVSVRPYRIAAVGWFGDPGHVITLVLVSSTALFAWIGSQFFLNMQKQKQLKWKTRPTQREFALSCLKRLQAEGWVYKTGFSRISVDVCRLEKLAYRARFLLCAGDFQMESVQRILSETRSTPFGKTIAVTWLEPSVEIQKIVNERGWYIIRAAEISNVEQFYKVNSLSERKE